MTLLEAFHAIAWFVFIAGITGVTAYVLFSGGDD